MERWEKLPEALRWVLYAPVVILLPLIIAFILRLVSSQWMPGWRWFAPIANFFVAVLGAYLAVWVFFPIVFRQCLSQENERLARTRSHAPQPLTGNPARK